MKPITFSGKLLIDGISFIGSYSFYWKAFILVEAIPFSFFSGKPLFLVEIIARSWNQSF